MTARDGGDGDPPDAPRWRSWPFAHPAAVAAAGWAAVWLGLVATGQDYSVRVLYAGWQMLPYDVLVADPLGAVWHLHTQPPLWNLQLGVVGAVAPGTEVGHAAISLLAGCVLAASICATLLRFGASPGTAWALTAAGTLNTQVLLYAFRPQYDLAVAALIAALVWSIARPGPADADGWSSLLLPVALATALVLTRALYHPLWLVAVLAVVGWRRRHTIDRRRAVAGLAIPLVLVGGWVVKNEVVVGRATMSSWTGMNLLRATLPAIDPDRVDELRDDGTVTDVAVIGPFRPYEAYADAVPPCEPDPSEHGALRTESRQVPAEVRTAGPFDAAEVPNFNFGCYLPVYDAASSDAWALMRHEPAAWATARLWAANNWFEAPAMRTADRSPLWPVLDEASRVVLLAVPHPGLPSAWADDEFWVHRSRWSLTLVAATLALAVAAVRRHRGSDDEDDHGAPHLALLVAAITVAWTMFVGIVAELGEQQRFRSATDPIVIALGGLVLVRAVATILRSRSRVPHVGRRRHRMTGPAAGYPSDMTNYRVNDEGVSKARSLIDAGQYVLESSWGDEAPSSAEENADIERHDYDQFGAWHLAIDTDASEETKDRFGFPFGDFHRVHRSALIAAKSRAAQNGHDAVAAVADDLLARLDAAHAG